MPPESSRPHRSRERESSSKNHHRKRGSSSRIPEPASASEESRSRGGTSNLLSADALAQFNRENARRGPEPRKERRRDPEQERGGHREREDELARARERRREREREREVTRERDRERTRELDQSKSKERRRDRERESRYDGDTEYRRERRRSRERDRRRDMDDEYLVEDRDGDRDRKRKTRPKPKSIADVDGYGLSKPRKGCKDEYREVSKGPVEADERYSEKRKNRRVVSGAVLEEGVKSKGFLRGGAGTSSYDSLEKEDVDEYPSPKKSRKRLWIYVGIGVGIAILIVIIAVAVVVSKNHSSSSSSSSSTSALDGVVVPSGAPSWLDPYDWVDLTDFNLTYTDEMVGDLPIMGLNSTWDDSAQANEYVPALDSSWGNYSSRPARGVNIGGWLSIEPFITPSLFNYAESLGIIDEWTLCTHLGSSCSTTLENHYASFVTEDTFKEIADAGLDHVRIPYSYWAVQTYEDDPYLYRTSWRYLLRGIEWARKYGLRVNLDLHALPGSQNGWNHSGRQGPIGWYNGTNGTLNAERSVDVHNRLSLFFAQDRYKNIISHYGLANEPKMTFLSVTDVLNWTATTYTLVRNNGLTNAIVVFGDGFRGLANWQGELTGYGDNLALDVHQYVIFNTNQVVYNHTEKISYACDGWTEQTEQSMDTSTGFGPTMIAEWSQADTDCASYLNNVGWGTRWTGTYVTGNSSLDITTPRCPTTDSQCECTDANAAASAWSDTYKEFLLMFAEAQMTSFEKGWGWWYWVWDTESAPQWSYKQGMAAGILPAKAYSRSFNCNTTIPSFSGLPEYY